MIKWHRRMEAIVQFTGLKNNKRQKMEPSKGKCGIKIVVITVNGKITKSTDSESKFTKIMIDMKVTGWKTRDTAKVDYF
jgi:hypothetical protein